METETQTTTGRAAIPGEKEKHDYYKSVLADQLGRVPNSEETTALFIGIGIGQAIAEKVLSERAPPEGAPAPVPADRPDLDPTLIKTTDIRYFRRINADGVKCQGYEYIYRPRAELNEKAIVEIRALIKELETDKLKYCPEIGGIGYQRDPVKCARYNEMDHIIFRLTMILAKNHIYRGA